MYVHKTQWDVMLCGMYSDNVEILRHVLELGAPRDMKQRKDDEYIQLTNQT